MTPETKLKQRIRLAVGQLDYVVLWDNPVGVATFDRKGRRWSVHYGLVKGAADTVGIVKPHGRWLALEVKTGKRKLTKEQRLFLNLINSMGGYGAEVRSLGEALHHAHQAHVGAAPPSVALL